MIGQKSLIRITPDDKMSSGLLLYLTSNREYAKLYCINNTAILLITDKGKS